MRRLSRKLEVKGFESGVRKTDEQIDGEVQETAG